MTEVVVSKSINISAKSAWDNLSSFRGIEDISPIERSVTEGYGLGAKRICYMPDGAAIYEVLSMLNESSMELEYKITEGPFPVTDYVSTIKVESIEKNKSKITWGCEFNSSDEVKADMINLFEGFYNTIIGNLENLILEKN